MRWSKVGQTTDTILRLYRHKDSGSIVLGNVVQHIYEDGHVGKPMIAVSTPSDTLEMFVPLDDYSHWCYVPYFDGDE